MPPTTKLFTAAPASCRGPFIRRLCLRGSETNKTVRRSFFKSATPNEELAAPKQESAVPFRKQLKDKTRCHKQDGGSKISKQMSSNSLLDKWELTVGIEIHAELNTAKKLFSTASTSVNDFSNTHVSHFDAAVPGTQPLFQKETLIPALRAALALNCKIQCRSTFDRKHYFYQDQPAGYQITQYYGKETRSNSST